MNVQVPVSMQSYINLQMSGMILSLTVLYPLFRHQWMPASINLSPLDFHLLSGHNQVVH